MKSDLIFSWYLRMFEGLSEELQIALIAKLVSNFETKVRAKSDTGAEDKLLLGNDFLRLFGAWADDDIDGDEIVRSRTVSNRTYDL